MNFYKSVKYSCGISRLSNKRIHHPFIINCVPRLLAFAICHSSAFCRTSTPLREKFLCFHRATILFLTESPLGCGACLLVDSALIAGSSNGGLLTVDGAAVCPSSLGVADECLAVGHRLCCLTAIADAPAGWAFSPRFHVSDVEL